ncbi:MAG: DUF3012 domain-containing protein [Gammaproteobacteria bacterium]|nr:DUF3012 domain-containing protein [Gammaproteobacteria bacterium]
MMLRTRHVVSTLIALSFIAIAACEPEVGSEAWCERMDDTPRGDWTANQAADYARNCLFD